MSTQYTQSKARQASTQSRLPVLFVLGFFFATNMALTSYINSSFLETILSPKTVGLVYMAGSLVTLGILFQMPRLLKKLGNYKITLGLILLSILSLSFFSFWGTSIWIILFFIIYTMTNSIVYANLDSFVEYYSTETKVGTIRGIYFSIQNLAWIVSPFLAGLLVEKIGFKAPYTLALGAMVLMFFGILFYLRNYKDPTYYKQVTVRELLIDVRKNKNIFNSYRVNVVLNFFYAWMVIYMPIYLHETIGFGWDTIGIMFTIMLLPFLLFQFPLGRLADKYIGEKEIMITGLCIIILSVLGVGFLHSHNAIIWTGILFLTRVGASMVEIAVETYFFKQITAGDTGFLGFYRSAHPISYISATLLASLLLIAIPMQYMFFILALIVCFGVYYASLLIDTK